MGRLKVGDALDETAKSAVRKLTTPAEGENSSPGIEVSAVDDYTFKVKGHRLTLVAEYKRAIDLSAGGRKSLVGLLEFRRVGGEKPEGDPVHTMWFDYEGRLSASGMPDDAVDYIAGDQVDDHRDARDNFMDQMAVLLDRLLPTMRTGSQ